MTKQEPITARAKQNGFLGDNSQTAMYHITLSTDSKGEYGAASVFVSTKHLTADIIALWSYDTDRSRKGTAAERAAVEEAALAAERARQAERVAEEAAKAQEPAPVAVHFCERNRFSVAHYGYTIVTSATDKAEALNKARRVIEREAIANGYRFEWHDDQAHLLAFDKDNNWCYTIYGIKALDSAPEQEHDRALPDFKPCTVEEATQEPEPLTAEFVNDFDLELHGEAVKIERYQIKLADGWTIAAEFENGELGTRGWCHNGSKCYHRDLTAEEREAMKAAYNQHAAPKADDRPDFLAGLSCGQVTQADDGENGLGAFVIGLYNENGSRLGTGFADIVGENGPAWELVCDDYLVDMSDEGWCSNDHGIAAVIAKAVADYTAPTGKRPNIRQYVAAKEAEAFHTDTPWFPRTEAERAAADGLSLEAWREAVEIESAEIERGGPGMDQLSAADQSPELRAFTHSQWELAAWGYNGDGTPHRKSAEERAQIIAQVIAGTESGPRTMSRGELVDLLAQAYTAGFEARKEQKQ